MTSTPSFAASPVGASVMVRDFRHSNEWIPGTIVRKLGPVTYHVDVGNGKILKRHIDHLTHRLEPQPIESRRADTAIIQDNFQYTGDRHFPEDPPDATLCWWPCNHFMTGLSCALAGWQRVLPTLGHPAGESAACMYIGKAASANKGHVSLFLFSLLLMTIPPRLLRRLGGRARRGSQYTAHGTA